VPRQVTHYQGPSAARGTVRAPDHHDGCRIRGGRRAGRAKPVEALAEAGLQRHWLGPFRLLGAVIFLAGGGALAA